MARRSAKHDRQYHNMRFNGLKQLIQETESLKTRKYLSERVLTSIREYYLRSLNCKRNYFLGERVSIFLNVFIAIFSVFSVEPLWAKFIIIILNSVVAAVKALLALYKCKDQWSSYQGAYENLEHVLYCYFNNLDIYENKPQNKKDRLVTENCEEIIRNLEKNMGT